jgi:hypothetical protein
VASAINNGVARVGGLLAVAVSPAVAGISETAVLTPATLSAGYRATVLIGCRAVRRWRLAVLRGDPPPANARGNVPSPWLACAIGALPLRNSVGEVAG